MFSRCRPFTVAAACAALLLDISQGVAADKSKLPPQAAGQTLVVNSANPGLPNQIYVGSPYTLPAGNAYDNVDVGYNSTGSMTQAGPGLTISSNLTVGFNPGGSGGYTLSAGALSALNEYAGLYVTGAINQSGGTNNVANELAIGYYAGSSGNYTLTGGILTDTSDEYIGYNGTGVFTHSSGTNNAADFVVGASTGGSGTYNLSNTGTLKASNEYVGYSGNATSALNQSGGGNTVIGTVIVGYYAGAANSTCTYALSGGTFSTNFLDVGYYRSGVFNQSGGTTTLSGALLVGEGSGGSGNYTLNGAASTLAAPTEVIGDVSTGIFFHADGTNTVNGNLVLGRNAAPASGLYSLNGGVLQANAVSGGSGSSTFKFLGGTLRAAVDNTTFFQGLTAAYVGYGGAYIDTNGHNITVAQALLHDPSLGSGQFDAGLGKFGAGTLTLTGVNTFTYRLVVTGGTLAIPASGSVSNMNHVTVDCSDAGTAVATLTNNGNIFAATQSASDQYIGTTGRGLFVQANGANTTQSCVLGQLSGSSGVYTLSGGVFQTASVTGGNGGSTFNFNGGTLQATGFNGSTMQGLGTANVQAGGAVIDSNATTFAIGQALLHDSALGATLDGGFKKIGAGTVSLGGANTYTGPTTVTNGLVTLSGTISNNSTVQVNSGTTLEVADGGSLRGGQINNAGRLRLKGSAVCSAASGIVNTGVVDLINWNGTLPTNFSNAGAGTVLRADSVRITSFARNAPSTGAATVTLTAFAGHTYTLQRNASLDAAGWADVGGASVTLPSDNAALSLIDYSAPTGSTGFYRVRITP